MKRTLTLHSTGLSGRGLRRLVALVVMLGVTWRLMRYLLCFPVWGDEAMLLVNYPGRGFFDLAGPLEHCQVAPLLFHWAELIAICVLGSGELAVRLPPLLACLGSLVLFARLARLVLPPLARGLAVAILAVSIWPVTLGSLVKPYTFDLFFSLALLLAAAWWHRQPRRLLPLACLVVVVPVAVLASYPAVLVAAAVSLACVPLVWGGRNPGVAGAEALRSPGSALTGASKTPPRPHRPPRITLLALFLLYNALLVGTFAVHYLLVARPQLASPVRGSTTAREMADYWRHGFPPREPVALGRWLVLAHTGQMAAYPIGAAAGGSAATVLLALLGAQRLWGRRRWLLVLFAWLFALGLIAAALRAYPYGASCRLDQHLAPVWCLLAGQGLAVLLARRRAGVVAALGVLALVGVAGIGRDLWRPYRDAESLWARHLTRAVVEHAGDEPVVTITAHERSFALLRWQMARHGDAVFHAGMEDWPRVVQTRSALWVLAIDLPDDQTDPIGRRLRRSGRPWRCVAQPAITTVERLAGQPLPRARLSRWVCEER
jgi:hypothetical protein